MSIDKIESLIGLNSFPLNFYFKLSLDLNIKLILKFKSFSAIKKRINKNIPGDCLE